MIDMEQQWEQFQELSLARAHCFGGTLESGPIQGEKPRLDAFEICVLGGGAIFGPVTHIP
jgi:hypothetical protein